MTTLLTPARSCFTHRGATSFLRPLLRTHENSQTPYLNHGVGPGPAIRFLSGHVSSSIAFPYSPPCRSPPTPRPRFSIAFRRHKSRTEKVVESLTQSWKSRVWQDGYDPNFLVVDYDKIPSSYVDSDGLRFASADLTQHEIRNIFGAAMSVREGNRLLRILHGRRVAGTLNHPEYFPNTAEFSTNSIAVGLNWLRRTVPVDETLNAALRAEEELAQIEEEQRAKEMMGKAPATEQATQTKPKKRKERMEGAAQSKETKLEPEPEPEYKPDPIYGYSPVDELRFKNQQEAKKREKKLEEERRAKLEAKGLKPEEIGTLMALDPNKIHLPKIPREMSPRMKEHQEKGMVSNLTEPPEMSLWARLAPSTIFTLVVLAIIFVANSMYTPPKERERLMPEIPFAVATMLPLVIVNLFVFMAWHRPQWWNFMNRFFILVPALPRPSSIFFSAFSQQQPTHLWSNLLGLVLLGIPLCDQIGRADFLSLTFGTAVVANLASLWWHVLMGAFHVATHGISAVVCAYWTMYFYLNRNERYRFGIPKEVFALPTEADPGVPGIVFVALFMLYNATFILVKKQKHKVDAMTHWSGILIGLGAAMGHDYRRELKVRRREERRKLLMGNPGVRGLKDAPGAVQIVEEKAIDMTKKVEEAAKEK